jgi:hypothetical protein
MKVVKPIHQMGERWYIQIDDKVVKIPWRYNRAMIKVNGIKTIYEYQIGDEIKAEVTLKKWEDSNHYILKSITDV